jgi:hypothetical protein
MNRIDLEKALHKAVREAIDRVGIEAFKKTSLFLSSYAPAVEVKKAA